MKFFGTPMVRKVKTGPVIKRLLVRCPATAKLAVTGQTIDEQLWAAAKVKTPKLTCPHCQQVHSWRKKDVVLAGGLRVVSTASCWPAFHFGGLRCLRGR